MEQPRMDSPIDAGPLLNGDGQQCFAAFEGPLRTPEALASDCTNADVLLLAWVLVLARYVDISDIEFTWGYSTNDGEAVESALTAADLPFKPDDSIGSLLEAVKSARQRTLPDTESVCATGETLFFTNSKDWTLKVEVATQDGTPGLQATWRTLFMTPYMAARHLESALTILNTLTTTTTTTPISPLLAPTPADLTQIWHWNQHLPPTITQPMHCLISSRAATHPSALAIDAWDGSWTYADVDTLSTRLAKHLRALGLGANCIAPLCFEKSRWTVIAVLAVMKTGAAFTLTDPSQPLARLQTIAAQVDARFVLTSARHAALGAAMAAPGAVVVPVCAETFDGELLEGELPAQVPLDALMYVIFTSGSTGKPKGVMLSHGAYGSGTLPRAAAVGYDEVSRVLDFASYAFDVAIDSMLATLSHGGCLCIPSDAERLNDLSGFIRRAKVTMANLTPSVARILDPDIVPGLRSLGVGGEAVTASDVAVWGKSTRVVNGYGPSEVGVGCTTNHSAATGRPYVSIGPGTGGVMWIVDREDHEKLVPVGAVGELLVEGPCVGEGYMGDPEKTAAAFIVDPPWLTAGFGDVEGRTGRVYKTGDLVKYDPDGSGYLVFVGRKDTQVKLRGQRVELGEVEYHLRAQLPARVRVAAEVIKPEGPGKQPMLVAFISDPETETTKDRDAPVERIPFSAEVAAIMSEMDDRLKVVLPKYMVPAAYIPINHMPALVSGKTDRKVLRQVGTTMVLQDLDKSSTSVGEIQEPTTPAETSLRKTWSRIFNLPEAEIGINHSFFALGGDSVLAMKLAAAAREDGLTLNVADIFSNPKLSAMASVAKETIPATEQDVAPFSLIDPSWSAAAARTEAAELCSVDASAIEDIYPCTPLQEVLMAFTARSTKSFVAQRIAEIPSSSSSTSDATIARLVSAWDAAAATSPILRTRVVQFRDHGLLQVVVREPIAWHTTSTSLDSYIAAEQAAPMGLGTPLSRWALVREPENERTYFVWTIHHALYDGFSTPLLLERVARAWRNEETHRPSQMKHFVAHLTHGVSKPAAQDYWRRALSGATGPQFPALPSRSYLPAPDALVERFVPLPQRPASSTSTVMPSTLIRAAWALVAAQHVGAGGDGDVVFGETMSGRASVPVAGAEQLEGPLIATVPVRVRVERGAPVGEYLLRVQEEGFARMAFEHVGMQHIRRVSPDAQIACEVKVGLVIQPGEIEEQEEEGDDDAPPKFRGTDAAREALHFNSYPLMLVCSLRRDGFLVMASFDSKLVAVPLMERVLAQFETAVQQLAKEEPVSVGDISLLTEQDREQIWLWNRTPPAGVDQATPRLVAGHVTAGDPYPSVVVPWIVDPANAERLMPIGTVGELVVEGPLASVDFVQDPSWLVKGSSLVPGRPGQVHRTGDLVKYTADGAILFVAKKESQTKLQGRAVDLAEVNRYLESLLPESTWVAAHIITPGQAQEPVLVAFVEARAQDESTNIVKLELTEDELPASVATSLPANLAERLLGLNKALSDLLPPYMIPGAYIPLKEMPLKPGEVDRAQLDTISSQLSQDIILKLRTAFTQLRAKGIDSKPWTTKERKLQKLWAQFLGIDPSNIDRDDSFFRLGGDSILAMRLVSAARQVGFKLSVADVFRRMRLSDMAAALEEADAAPVEVKTFAPFSALDGIDDVNAFLAQEIQPALADPSWNIADVLPVTDAQARDVAATVDPACRSAVQYTMLYLPKSIDRARLLACCQQLVDHHEILRTVFVQQGNRFLQVILESLTAPVVEIDAPEEENNIEAYANKLFAADIDGAAADLALGAPFLKLFYIAGRGDEDCLAIRLSHAQYDGVSLPELIRQVELLYSSYSSTSSPSTAVIPATPPFSTYIHALSATRTTHHAAALTHWRSTLSGSQLTPSPHPALASNKTARSAFTQRAVDVSARPADVTPATLLSTAWALVLAQRHGVRDVVFGGIGTGRGVGDVPGLADAAGVVGPCYGFVPIRVRFDSDEGAATTTAAAVLRRVQEERARGVAFERVGFAELVEECGLRGTEGWEGNEWFESIVHHQDVDDFDEMPFAGGTARVEIANPHPERAWPVRVVSFVRGGKFWYGIQADEGKMDVAEELLGEVCEAVERLLARPDEPLF